MGKNYKQRTYIKFRPGDNLCNNDRCMKCMYFAIDTKSCDYMLKEHQMRDCGVGNECTKWRSKKEK